MKRKLFYLLTATTSYFAGVLAYLGYLKVVYHQGMGSDGWKLLAWTFLPYLFLILPFYTIMFIIRRSLWGIRAILLIVLSIIAALSVPSMMGFGIWSIRDFFSPEMGLFILFFASSALVFTIGTWIANNKRGYLPFIICSIFIIGMSIIMLASEVK